MQVGLRRIPFLALLFAVPAGLHGCSGIGDITLCNDGIDNDGDGFIDSQDEGCLFNDGLSESPNPVQCNDGIDNDGDGLIDDNDPGCTGTLDNTEFHLPRAACNDGVDNDGDGITDYPFDPGCFLPLAESEEDNCPNGDPCPACSNGIDDDGDGRIDFPQDPGCTHAAALDEYDLALNACGGDILLQEFPELSDEVSGTVIRDAVGAASSPRCGGENGGETVWAVLVREPSTLMLSTSHPTTTADTIIYVRTDCLAPDSELVCNDNENAFVDTSRVLVDIEEPGYYYVFVDTADAAAGGGFRLNVDFFTLAGQPCDPDFPTCAPGQTCRPATPTDTDYLCLPPQCRDGRDNDADGLIDFPEDPGCATTSDVSETDPCPGPDCPQCSNEVDDDADGLIDFPAETLGCVGAFDNDEGDHCFPGIPLLPYPEGGVIAATISGPPVYKGSCATSSTPREDIYGVPVWTDLASLRISTIGSPDDMVTYVRKGDCTAPADEVACADATAYGEEIILEKPEQGVYYVFVDGYLSNDLGYTLEIEGLIAPGDACDPSTTVFRCSDGHACDPTSQTCVVARCIDGVDNDADGLTDYPDDPGCETISDDDEADDCPGGVNCAQCANDIDDDQDGAIDFGNDPGCATAGDLDEIDACIPGRDPTPLTDAGLSSTTPAAGGDFTPSCNNAAATENVHYYLLTQDLSSLTFSTEGSSTDTVVSVRYEVCGDPTTELACADTPGGGEAATVDAPAQGMYYVFVDGNFVSGIDYDLAVSGTLAQGQSCDPADTQFTCDPGLFCNGVSLTCVRAQCDNGMDDDGDGTIDYPNDPGCDSLSDNDELDDCPGGVNCAACSNQIDDDADGAIDFGDDLGCIRAIDNDELDECIPGVMFTPLTEAGATGTTPPLGSGSNFTPSCQPSPSSTEHVYAFGVFRDLRDLTFSTVGSAGDTVLSVRREQCGDATYEVACRNQQNGGETITIDDPAPGIYYAFVDGDWVSGIPYALSVSGTIRVGESCDSASTAFVCEPGSACNPGSGLCEPALCDNGVDDDGDGLIDYPNDPGCADIDDTDEADLCPGDPSCPACSNGVDDDGDGLIDYPNDLGCLSASEVSEGDCDSESDPVDLLISATVAGNTVGMIDDSAPSCVAVSSAPDKVYFLQVPGRLATMTLSTNGSDFDTVLSLESPSCDVPADIACDDNSGLGTQSQITLTDVDPGQYAITIDGWAGSAGNYVLHVSGAIVSGEVCDPSQIAAGMFVCGNGGSCLDPMGTGTFTCQ